MKDLVRQGSGVSPGVAIGPALVLERRLSPIPRRTLKPGKAAAEVERLERAVARAREELAELRERTGRELGENIGGIFEAQALMLADEAFSGAIERRILERGQNAEWAVCSVGDELSRRLHDIGDEHLRQRYGDVDDLRDRLLRVLSGDEPFRFDELDEPVVLFAYDLAPSDTAMLDPERVLGFATDVGGPTSHSAIMARSLEIPAVVGLHDVSERVENGDLVVVDGNEGTVVLRPSASLLQEYRNKQQTLVLHERELLQTRGLPATTPDGFTVRMLANIESDAEAASALEHGAEGIGLYRTEFLFLRRPDAPPDEETHYAEYRAVLERMAPAPVTIRTMDLGGDKDMPEYLGPEHETSTLLGLRAIRQSLRQPEAFGAQLRGLLRASIHGELRIILPFISSVEELRQAKLAIEEARRTLEQRGQPVAPHVPLGVMIEVPAAALIVDHLAAEADFFSIGTNDLIQYLLAVDRTNEEVAYLYEPLHPAVLRLVRTVVDEASRRDLPVSICGEAAADPLTAMIFLGFGIDELSMSASAIPIVKNVVRTLPRAEAQRIVVRALDMRTSQEVEEFALEQLMAHFPDGFLIKG